MAVLTCELVDRPALMVWCAHCGHAEADDYEVVSAGATMRIRCSSCAADFAFLVVECAHCGGETAFSWTHAPSEAACEALTCMGCHRTLHRHEAPVDPVGHCG